MNIKRIFRNFIRTNVNFVKQEFEQKKINVEPGYDFRELYDIVHKQAEPCFVLSTGRCGTELLTKLFELDKSLRTYHVPSPELVYYSNYAYKNYATKHQELKTAVDSARYELIRNSFILDQKYTETNNRITFFAYQLAELYPNSKFIHLIRNPISFVKSGLKRNWYTGNNPHDEGRIKLESPEWNEYSDAKKIAWLWNETNQFIEEFQESVNPDRVLTVFAESLFNSADESRKIFNFLSLSPPDERKINKLISNPVNPSKKREITISEKEMEDLKKVLTLSHKYGY
jgi:hypothetical protein